MNSTATPAAPSLQISEIDLCVRIGQASLHEPIEYHRGFLVVDTDPRMTALSRADRQELVHVAQRAWKCAEQGLVYLVQRRRGPNEFSYLAIRRARPGALFGSLPSAEFEEAA